MFTDSYEDILDIARQSLSRRYVIFRPPCFHKRTKPAVIDNLKRSVALSNPMNKLGTEAHQGKQVK